LAIEALRHWCQGEIVESGEGNRLPATLHTNRIWASGYFNCLPAFMYISDSLYLSNALQHETLEYIAQRCSKQ